GGAAGRGGRDGRGEDPRRARDRPGLSASVAGRAVPRDRALPGSARARLAPAERARGRRGGSGERTRLSAPVAHRDLRLGRELLSPLLLPAPQDLRLLEGDGPGRFSLSSASGRGPRVLPLPRQPAIVVARSLPWPTRLRPRDHASSSNSLTVTSS